LTPTAEAVIQAYHTRLEVKAKKHRKPKEKDIFSKGGIKINTVTKFREVNRMKKANEYGKTSPIMQTGGATKLIR